MTLSSARLYLVVYALLFTISLGGCAAVGKRFAPKSAVKEESLLAVARDIETAIRKGERTPNIQDRDGIVVNTPLVMQTIKTRAARRQALDDFLDGGFGWERRDGLVYVLLSKDYKKATQRRQRAHDAFLVQEECRDRWALYEGIQQASHLGMRSLDAIQAAFYKARVESLKIGHQYEDAEGKPAVKQ